MSSSTGSGEPPASVKGLLDVALLRNTAAGLGVTEVKQQGDSLLVYKEKFDVAEVGPLIKALGGRVLLSAGSKPYISVKMAGQPPHPGPLGDFDRHAGKRRPQTVRHFTISV